MIQIENRAEESDDGEDDDHAAYYLIDNDDAVGIKLIPNLVDEPGESEPPWWFGLTWLVDKIRNKFDTNGIVIINKVIGSVVIIFSIIALFGTIFNLYHLPEF